MTNENEAVPELKAGIQELNVEGKYILPIVSILKGFSCVELAEL